MSDIIYNCNEYNDFSDINKTNWNTIKNVKIFAIKIDMTEIKPNKEKQLVKKILRLRKKSLKNKKIKKDLNGIAFNIINYNENNEKHKNIRESLIAILKDNDKEMYEYVYDNICEYLDSYFYGKNLCGFKNNKCEYKINTTSNVGCCRHYENRILGPLKFNNKLVQCEHLKNNKCSAKCLPCKLFTCDYLEKKGIKFRMHEIFLLDTFFNLVQKAILKFYVYTPRKKIIKKILLFKI